jgi:hypothetical protein
MLSGTPSTLSSTSAEVPFPATLGWRRRLRESYPGLHRLGLTVVLYHQKGATIMQNEGFRVLVDAYSYEILLDTTNGTIVIRDREHDTSIIIPPDELHQLAEDVNSVASGYDVKSKEQTT